MIGQTLEGDKCKVWTAKCQINPEIPYESYFLFNIWIQSEMLITAQYSTLSENSEILDSKEFKEDGLNNCG